MELPKSVLLLLLLGNLLGTDGPLVKFTYLIMITFEKRLESSITSIALYIYIL